MAIDTTELDQLIIGRVEPHIYAFSTNTIPNYLKVGDTYRPVSERLAEWEKFFPHLEKQFEGSAKINDEVYFRDFAVHQYLETIKGRRRLQLSDLAEGIYYSREFFKEATSDDVKEAIEDIESDYEAKSQRYQFYNAENRLPEATRFARTDSYPTRPNQDEVIQKFENAVRNDRTNLLMYAVMRFGKSFTSMCCAVKMGAKLVVVVSAKADVKLEWKRTVESHVRFADYDFITSKDLKGNKYLISEKIRSGRRVVCFLTLQDLKDKKIKEHHKEVFENEIDLLLVDESHFGARADVYGKVLKPVGYQKDIKKHKRADDDFVETEEADKAVKALNAKITIHLSGTPYRILMGSEFKKEDIIAFFQFADIVRAQKEWDDSYILDDSHKEWDNPYFGFPQMIRFAFNPNESSRKLLKSLKHSGIAYAFSALLEPCSVKKEENGKHKKFKHEQEVLELLEVIDGSKEDEELLGFLNYDKIKQGNMCRHIVVVLPYCASCDALEQLLKDNQAKFKNLNEYQIINISGVENESQYKDSQAVKNAIRAYEASGKKTITLTVNRMLTGSTVPEWDTMLYLKDTSSPQEYDQAIFRLQNQYIKTYKDESGNTIKFNMKPQTLLVDFDPNRMFVMQEQKSLIYNVNVDIGGNRELESRIREDLEISPIITLNKDKIERVKAVDILTAVSDYQKDKGVREEASEIPIDMGILDDEVLKSVIEKENELGSRAGLATNAYTGEDDEEGTDFNAPDPNSGDDSHEEQKTQQEPASEQKNNDKNEQISLEKKIRSYYARILLYAFLTNDPVLSLSDIIQTIDSKDNNRLAQNIGLHKSVLVRINRAINKFVLSQLDYKIKDLNDLAKSQSMTAEEKTSVAIKKFGKLGDAIVVTPSNICDDMIALLPEECLRAVANGNGKLLDIAGTAGEFAMAIAKRMTALGIDKAVIANSIYTIPKSKLCYELIRKVYEMLGLNVQNIAKQIEAIYMFDKNRNPGLTQECIVKIISQNKSFDQIKLTDTPQEGAETVKFEAVVGNPPYQEIVSRDVGNKSLGKQLFPSFIKLATATSKRYTILITPSKWFTSEGQDGSFIKLREFAKQNNHFKYLRIFSDNSNIFDGVLLGSINYFMYDSLYAGDTVFDLGTSNQKRPLFENGLDVILPYGQMISIVKKIRNHPQFVSLTDYTCGRDAFGISGKKESLEITTTKEFFSGAVTVRCAYEQIRYIERNRITKNSELVDKWKIFTSKGNGAAGTIEYDKANSIIGKAYVASPNSACSDSLIPIGAFETQVEAENLCKYMATQFLRFMVGIMKTSRNITQIVYRFVPLQDFTEDSDIDWSKSVAEIDQQLYCKYKLSCDEIAFIEKTIKPME